MLNIERLWGFGCFDWLAMRLFSLLGEPNFALIWRNRGGEGTAVDTDLLSSFLRAYEHAPYSNLLVSA